MKSPQIRFFLFLTLLILAIISGLTAGFMFRGTGKAYAPHTTKVRCQSSMKNIAWALLVYYEKQGQFPPLTFTGDDGKTSHSWRAALLPYLEINDYHMTEPWNSEHNLNVGKAATKLFACPASRNDGNSTDYSLILYETGKDEEKKRAYLLVESIHSGLKCLEPGDVSLDGLKRGFRSPNDTKPQLICGGNHRSGKTMPLPDGSGVSFPPEHLWTDGWFNVIFITPDHIRSEQFDYKSSPDDLLKIAEEVADFF